MRSTIPTLCLAAALAAGCGREATPPTEAPKPAATVQPAGPAYAETDEHSYAQPAKVRITDLARPRIDDIPIRASIGCARYRPGSDAMQLYREADAAMYAAKAQGGGKLVCEEGHCQPAHTIAPYAA